MSRRSLLDLSHDELRAWLEARGEPGYRADQLWRAVYGELIPTYDAITTLPHALRVSLAKALPIDPLRPVEAAEDDAHRVRKQLFALEDGETIEAVLMHYERRHTACLSSQVGCPVGCSFCATGQDGYARDLSSGEIIAQALHFARELRATGQRLSHIVYMGMGEPLLNEEAVLRSIRALNDPRGFGLGMRSFTVSTAGVAPGIRHLAHLGLEVGLAVSLHTVDDDLRSALIPLNRTYGVETVLTACRAYLAATHRRITFEVALFRGVNDSVAHARRLADTIRGMLCHVNLIPGNPCPETERRPSTRDVVEAYAEVLRQRGIPVTVRVARGLTIAAGCGQLRRRRAGGVSR
jgi:23S rRNA (adenine2503-C2)-methyltransferase